MNKCSTNSSAADSSTKSEPDLAALCTSKYIPNNTSSTNSSNRSLLID